MRGKDWVSFDPYIQKRYAGQVIVYRGRRVWGAGPDLDAALAAARAEEGCPEEKRLRNAIIPDEDLSFYPLAPMPKRIPKKSKGTST